MQLLPFTRFGYLLSGVKWQFCLVYLDDVIIYSNSEREHIDPVDQVLRILRRAGLSLKFRKIHFFKKSVNYLGHTIRPGKLEIAMKRTEALEGNFLKLKRKYAVSSDSAMCIAGSRKGLRRWQRRSTIC